MTILDLIICLIIAVLCGAAIAALVRQRRRTGSFCSDCRGCANGSGCAAAKHTAGQIKKNVHLK
ncbi:MAG: hypothetical protein ACOX41_04055 [Anaerovoracaceae bacterium]|jgi:hypothetical protein